MDELLKKNPDYFKHLTGNLILYFKIDKANAFAIKQILSKDVIVMEIKTFSKFYPCFKLYITIPFHNLSQLYRSKFFC